MANETLSQKSKTGSLGMFFKVSERMGEEVRFIPGV